MALSPQRPLACISLGISLALALPILVILANIFRDTEGIWQHLWQYKLGDYVSNSLQLMLGVSLLTTLLGVPTAWLVTQHQFPGRSLFEWLLLLPLAFPTYIMAYTYTDLLDYAGPVQSSLRHWFGWSRQDYWFPAIRTMGGTIAVMSFVLYPYVYLLCRTAFQGQSICLVDAGRTLGHNRWQCFYRVALPIARPAIIAGLSLVLMEVLADYGAVDYFAIDTFTTGIYRTWFGLGSPVAAAKLSAILLIFVFCLLFIERRSRTSKRYHHNTSRQRQHSRTPLPRTSALIATLFCLLPISIGFLIPSLRLAYLSYQNPIQNTLDTLLPLIGNSLTLAGTSCLIAVVISLLLAYSVRIHQDKLSRASLRIASLGYAIPGSVIAVGVLIPLAWTDNALNSALHTLGIDTGLILTGSIWGLLFAYTVRFLAISLNTIESGLGKINITLDWASRTLGKKPIPNIFQLHIPLMRSSLFTAALLVFVEVLKELPATMIVRPFNLETLAVRVYNLASDERLTQAAPLCLAIVASGIIPIIILSTLIRQKGTHATN